MILAEALNLRANLQERISQVRERIIDNVKVQEGDKPMESPEVLFVELNDLFIQLQELIYRINKVQFLLSPVLLHTLLAYGQIPLLW